MSLGDRRHPGEVVGYRTVWRGDERAASDFPCGRRQGSFEHPGLPKAGAHRMSGIAQDQDDCRTTELRWWGRACPAS
jgi:hypothetical protein